MHSFKVTVVIACLLVLCNPLLVQADTNTTIIKDTILWKHTLPTYITTSHDFHGNTWSNNNTQPYGFPTVIDGVVYVQGGRAFYAYDAYTGIKLWNNSFESGVIVDGIIYSATPAGLFAYRTSDGEKVWNYSEVSYYDKKAECYQPTYNAFFFDSPTVIDGKVYAISCNGDLMVFNAYSGVKLWSSAVGNSNRTTWYSAFSTPIIANNIIYTTSEDDNTLYALNVDNGKQIWQFKAEDHIYVAPAVADRVVYIGSGDGNFFALDATNGQKLWNFTAPIGKYGSDIIRTPIVSNGIVYVCSIDYQIFALNTTTGTMLWQLGPFYDITTPIIADGILYIGNVTREIYALNATLGTQITKYTLDGIPSSPAIANGVLYVGTQAGSIYAIGSPSGTPTYQVTSGQDDFELTNLGIELFIVVICGVLIVGIWQYQKKPKVGG